MQILTVGHKYVLDSFEKSNPQVIQFIEKAIVDQSTGELKTINDGTTNEEVLRMLIDRLNNMNSKFPCRENSIVITKLEESLMWLEKRTAERKSRNVEGKALK